MMMRRSNFFLNNIGSIVNYAGTTLKTIKEKKTLSCDFLVTVGTFWFLKFFVVPSVFLLILCFQYWSTVYQVVLDTPRWFSPAFWSLAHSVLSLPLLYGFWAEFL